MAGHIAVLLRRHANAYAFVGAGLPAMQAPRFISVTEAMLSQASQLPHKPGPRVNWRKAWAVHTAR